MTFKQIATILNNQFMKNEIPEGDSWVQLAEDLSNFADWGVQVTTGMNADALLNAKKNIAVQIKNITIARILESKTFSIVKDNITYEGAIQRIMSTGLLPAQNSSRRNLTNGTSYIDGKYYGQALDARLYSDFDTFKIVNSVTDKEWELAFSDASEMRKVLGLMEINVENSIVSKLNALAKRLLVSAIDNCVNADNPRVIHLLTGFNAKHNSGSTAYTLATIYKDRDLTALFHDYVKGEVNKLVTYTQEYNKKYNNGEVEQFTPRDKVEIVLLTDFANDIKYITDPVDYNIVGMPTYREITSWQTTTDSLNPSFSDVSTIKVVDTSAEGGSRTISNVVGFIYDTDGIGITSADGEKATSIEYVGAEGFTNYHHHVTNRYYIDDRLSSVVLALD